MTNPNKHNKSCSVVIKILYEKEHYLYDFTMTTHVNDL